MKTELKDVIHLYLGCRVKVPSGQITFSADVLANWDYKHHGIKPILRRISTLTQQDLQPWIDLNMEEGAGVSTTKYAVEIDSNTEYGNFIEICKDGSILCVTKDDREQRPFNGAMLYSHLLSLHIDLFNLIDSEQAVDADSLTPNPYKQ